MPNKFLPYDFILEKDFQKDLNFKACVVHSKFACDDIKQPMVPNGYWIEIRIKQLSNNQKMISELDKKNKDSSKQYVISINVVNVKQKVEYVNKKNHFSDELMLVITNNKEINAAELIDANHEKQNLQGCVNI